MSGDRMVSHEEGLKFAGEVFDALGLEEEMPEDAHAGSAGQVEMLYGWEDRDYSINQKKHLVYPEDGPLEVCPETGEILSGVGAGRWFTTITQAKTAAVREIDREIFYLTALKEGVQNRTIESAWKL